MRNSIFWVICVLASPAMAQDACQIAASAKTGAFPMVPIHAAPTSTSEVLDVAPQYQEDGTGPVLGARFVVTEMRSGWARVTGVTDWSGQVEVSDGWIGASNVVLSPQTYRGFAVASASSKVAWESGQYPIAEVLIDCKADWGKVRLRSADGSGATTAWVRGFCDDPVYGCEGIVGD